tara:strand:+ start:543 stop:1037 length:495 start_codon:yes stop_codon:yes gene_type:complete
MRFLALFLLFNTSLFAQEGVWYKDLDHALANPDSVFQLQLKKKGLSAFPSELSQFPNLQKLDLSNNKIGAFPDSLNYLINLTFLDLSRNNIVNIPASISQLIFLEHLDLWQNDVDALPYQISELPQLNYLDIRGVSMSHSDYGKYKELMKGVNFYMSAPCDCQD